MMGAVDSGEEHDGENKKKEWKYAIIMVRREIVITVAANY